MSRPALYLCRHGQTDWNAEGRLQGQRDIPLNDLGRAQAQRNGRYLRNVLGDEGERFRFVSSPLSRACETMRLIRGEMGLDPDGFQTDDQLIELSFGDWEGSTLGELRAVDPDAVKRRKADKWNFLPPGPGAESYEILARRVKPFFEAMSAATIVTAHGGIVRSFLRLYGGYDEQVAGTVGIAQDRILYRPETTACEGAATFEWV